MIRSLLLATLLATSSLCFSQSEMCDTSEFTPLCNQLSVEIRPACLSDCIPDEAACRQLAFDVFLKTQNQMPSYGQPLCYQDLSVTLNVLSDQSPSFSRINADQSETCSATAFGSSTLLEIDEEANMAVWTNAGTSSHPSIMFYPGNQLCSLLGNSAAYLFTIVVDVMPGETISVGCADLVYTRPETGSADYNQNGILECADVETGDEDPNAPAKTTILFCFPDTSALPNPILANPDVTVVIEAPDLTGMPNGAMVPVTLSSSLTTGTVTFLDFIVRLTVDQLMTPPVFVAGDFTIEPGFDEPIAVPNATDPNINDYLFHVRFRGIDLSLLSTGNELFSIRLNAPVYMSEGGEVCFSGVKGMAETTENCGRVVFDETNAECVDFGGFPVCNEDFQVYVQGVVPSNGQTDDCKSQVYVRFNWTSSQSTYELHSFNFQLDVDAASGILLENISLNTAVDCPSTNDPAFCASGCAFGTGSQSFKICFKQGAPNDFLTINKSDYILLEFDVPSNCIGNVTLRKAEFGLVSYDSNHDPVINDVCRMATPDPTDILSSLQVSGFPLCVPLLTGEIKNYKSVPEPVSGVSVEVKRSNASNTCTMVDETDCYGFSPCICGYDEYDVTPMKTDDVVNGVSAFDLVSINKHILGIEPFDSPFKIIAADCNNGNSVTTFDIAILRQLILGYYDDSDWPGRNSWSFVPENYVFPNPADPFTPPFPEAISALDIQANSNNQANFVAIKMGDVNLSHVTDNCRPVTKNQQKPTGFRFESEVLGKSKAITYTFKYEGNEPLTAFQGGFRYDPQLLEFIGATSGDVEGITPDCFGLTRVADGEIRLVWLSPDMESHFLQPRQALCHFAFRTKGALIPEDAVIKLDDLVLEGEAVSVTNEVFRPTGNPITSKERNQSAMVSGQLQAEFIPNPLTGSGRLVIHSNEPSAARLMMFDAFGKRVGYREFSLTKGTQEILLPETSEWPSGMYSWLLLIGSNRVAEGKVVKP